MASPNYKKILKNNTLLDIEISETGHFVPASSQYIIEPSRYWSYADIIGETGAGTVNQLILDGDIIVNDGVGDLSPDRGIDYLKYPDRAFNVRFESNPERVNGFVSKNVQQAIEESRSGFEGKGFQVSFVGNGPVKNEWLQQEDQNIESNQTPDIFKYTARLVGIDFSNENQNADTIIMIAIKDNPYNNINTIDRSYKWTINNARSAARTNQVTGFIVNPGDLMSVYVKDNGGDPSDMVISMDFIVISAENVDIKNNYSGNFNSNDFPDVSLIPEILI